MQKPTHKPAKTQIKNTSSPPLQLSYILILLAYALITLIIPSFETYDSNAPKFLALSLLNLFSFLFLFSQKDFRSNQGPSLSFFKNKIGLAYTLFMAVILISFTKAINLPESILNFSKYFTVFCTAYILSILLRADKRYFRMLLIVMTLVLILDSLTVFFNILLYVLKQLDSIYEIKSIYSNKNILAAAIFVKIPFALWLLTFEKGWLKKLGYISLFCAELAIFFMSTRAFYMGLIFLVIIYGIYLIILYFQNRKAIGIKSLSVFLGIFLFAFLFFTFTQHFLYPKKIDIYNQSYTERFSTISSGESGRIDSWKRSVKLFKQEPLLGVGSGNWKIRILQYENPEKSNFTLMVRAHNDFIEIFTETGVFGGLLFISLFVFLVLNFVMAFFKSQADENSFIMLFLPAFGIFCYSFDAFFNFPADRPEIQSLFALFIGAGIAYSPSSFFLSKLLYSWLIRLLSLVLILLLIAISYVFQINTQCSKLQYLYQSDLELGRFTHTSEIFVNGYPSLLNLSSSGESIAVIKSNYLINEGKYQDAINLLRPDKSSPYLGNREVFIALAYSKIGNNDSVLYYAKKVYALKPRYFSILNTICEVLETQGKWEEAEKMLKDFTAYEKSSRDAWLSLVAINKRNGNFEKAIQSINSAVINIPGDTSLLQMQHELNMYVGIIPYQQIFTIAMKYYNQQKFPEALKYLEDINSKKQGLAIVCARRAVCYFYAKEYQKCINDVNYAILGGYDNPELLNIRGACYHTQGRIDAACSDFHTAAAKGYNDAINNVERFCKMK